MTNAKDSRTEDEGALAARRLRPFVRALKSPRLPAVLFFLFLAWFGVWAIRPLHPRDFVVEHVLTVVWVVLLVLTRKRFRWSNVSYLLLFLFLCLHVVGAHYTYAHVPYVDWLRAVAGWFGGEGPERGPRNHYDRFAHFSFGLLCAYPIREMFLRIAAVRGFWGYVLPLDMTLSFSAIYELVEWGVAMVAGASIAQTYLATQGDEWDAQKDMALAGIGAVITVGTTLIVNWRLQRDFAGEFAESMRVKQKEPLGEVDLDKMLAERERAEAGKRGAAESKSD